jgi:hypothetical protein
MIERRSDRNVRTPGRHIGALFRFLLAACGFGIFLAAATIEAYCAEQQRETETVRVAVYDVPPYGYVEPDGSISGVSVDLWRRVAEQMEWPFKLIPVSDMESILSGLEQVVSTRRSAPSRSRRKERRASIFRIPPIGPALRSPYERKQVRFSQ